MSHSRWGWRASPLGEAEKCVTPQPIHGTVGETHFSGEGFLTQREFAKPIMIERARDLRADATIVERKLWQHLRDRKMGVKFRRQHPVAGYILDFACEEKRLGIELDGGQHNEARGLAYDAKRTAALEKSGWRMLRFWNNDVLTNFAGVYEVISQALAKN